MKSPIARVSGHLRSNIQTNGNELLIDSDINVHRQTQQQHIFLQEMLTNTPLFSIALFIFPHLPI